MPQWDFNVARASLENLRLQFLNSVQITINHNSIFKNVHKTAACHCLSFNQYDFNKAFTYIYGSMHTGALNIESIGPSHSMDCGLD